MTPNSKIYIAGHGGLVGSAIWRNLEEKGYTNLIGRTFAQLDLRNQSAVEHFFATEKPDYVILAAAKVGGIMANNTYRADFIYENLMIQNNVIHQAYVHGVKKLLFLGSTCIYPKEAPQPMKEEYLLTGQLEPTNEPYAIAKIAGMKMCEAYNRQYGTDFFSVMPTNLYGPNDNFDLETSHVLPAMIRKIHLAKLLEEGNIEAIELDLLNQGLKSSSGTNPVTQPSTVTPPTPVTSPVARRPLLITLEQYGITQTASGVTLALWGTGTPLREFMWSEDMADACIYLMNREMPDVHSKEGPSFVNLGTGKEISIRDLAYLIKDIAGFKGELKFDSTKPDGTLRKVTDVTRLHALGWHHKVELEEGIRRLYGLQNYYL